MFTAETIAEITGAAKDLDVEPAALLAVAEVESGGQAFALVEGRREPLIRFEGHYFDRRLSEQNRAIAREKGELKPYLDQWEGLPAAERARLRAGRPGEILDALEAVAHGIQARHQAMFGDDGASAKPAKEEPPQDLSQMINLYRGLQ